MKFGKSIAPSIQKTPPMYTIESSINPSRPSDAQTKYEPAYGKDDKAPVRRRQTHSQQNSHEGIIAVQRRSEPWMERMSVSTKDLIWGSCNVKEEAFMTIRPKSPPLINTSSMAPEPLVKMARALSSLPGHSGKSLMPTENDLSWPSDRNPPRFRQDTIMDHVDVELRVQGLQTTLQRSISSDSTPDEPPLKFSDSFIASQKEMMVQIESSSSGPSSSERLLAGKASPARLPSPSAGSTKTMSPQRMASPKLSSPQRSSREETVNSMGCKVRIHDEERVYRAMDDGTASIIQCVGCSKHMMAASDIELVLCPNCGTLTPFEVGILSESVICGAESP